MTLDGMRSSRRERSADVDGQDAAAVPGAGVGVVERVGGLDGRPRPRLGDVALRRAPPRRRSRAPAAARRRRARSASPSERDGDDRRRVLPAAHRLRVVPALAGREADRGDERPVDLERRRRRARRPRRRSSPRRRARAGRRRGRRAAAGRTGCRRPSPGCGSSARRSTRSRRAGTATSRPTWASVVAAPIVSASPSLLDAGQPGAAQADAATSVGLDARHHVRCRRRSAAPAPSRPTASSTDSGTMDLHHLDHRVAQHPDALDLAFDDVAVLERALRAP